eukprot:1287720-Amphidinium_carterae.1
MYYFPRRKVGKVETTTKMKSVKQQDQSELSPAELEKFVGTMQWAIEDGKEAQLAMEKNPNQ